VRFIFLAALFFLCQCCQPGGPGKEGSNPISKDAETPRIDTAQDNVPALLLGESEMHESDCIMPPETMPQFPGGPEKLATFLGHTLRMPKQAKRKKITGTVFVHFVIDSTGTIEEVQVLKGIGCGCDEEAVRVMKRMPRWKPGEQMGRRVPVRYSLPIRFINK
jgi:protein TonB